MKTQETKESEQNRIDSVTGFRSNQSKKDKTQNKTKQRKQQNSQRWMSDK